MRFNVIDRDMARPIPIPESLVVKKLSMKERLIVTNVKTGTTVLYGAAHGFALRRKVPDKDCATGRR